MKNVGVLESIGYALCQAWNFSNEFHLEPFLQKAFNIYI